MGHGKVAGALLGLLVIAGCESREPDIGDPVGAISPLSCPCRSLDNSPLVVGTVMTAGAVGTTVRVDAVVGALDPQLRTTGEYPFFGFPGGRDPLGLRIGDIIGGSEGSCGTSASPRVAGEQVFGAVPYHLGTVTCLDPEPGDGATTHLEGGTAGSGGSCHVNSPLKWSGAIAIWTLGAEIDFGEGAPFPFDEIATLTDVDVCMDRYPASPSSAARSAAQSVAPALPQGAIADAP